MIHFCIYAIRRCLRICVDVTHLGVAAIQYTILFLFPKNRQEFMFDYSHHKNKTN